MIGTFPIVEPTISRLSFLSSRDLTSSARRYYLVPMKCPICKKDHFGLCYQCPHQNEVAGKKFDKNVPCWYCMHYAKGRIRKNDSREEGHGRVVSLSVCEAFVADRVKDAEVEADAAMEPMREFIRIFMPLDPKIQYIVIQRAFFSKELEEIARGYRTLFGVCITPAGVSSAFSSAVSRLRRKAS